MKYAMKIIGLEEHMSETNYIAKIHTKYGFECEYPVYGAEKIIEELSCHVISPGDIWALTYDCDNSFYDHSKCILIVNENHDTDEGMFKAGYEKVISLRKEVIGTIEEEQYF